MSMIQGAPPAALNPEGISPVGGMERFERVVVFRVARGYFFAMAVLGVLTVIGGVIALSLGLVRIPISDPAPPPPIAPPEVVNLARVDKWLAERQAASQQKSNGPSSVFEDSSSARTGHGEDNQRNAQADLRAEAERLEGELRVLFPAPNYVWDDQYLDYCKNMTSFGCIERGRKLEKEGVAKTVRAAFSEFHRISDVVDMLKLMIAVLKEAPVERRGNLILAVVTTYRDINGKYLDQVQAREAAIERAQAEYKTKVREQEESKSTFRTYGIYGAVGGLALLILVSLFLAHFAIERHLRLLQKLVASVQH